MPVLKRLYVVQPYWRSPKGLAAGRASRHESETEARSKARSLLPTYQGAQVLAVDVEEQLDFCSDPVPVFEIGDVPEASF